MVSRIWLFLNVCFLMASCQQGKSPKEGGKPQCAKEASLPVRYAKGFAVDYYNGFKVITVKDLKDSAKVLVQYVLLPKGKSRPADFPNGILLDTPVRKVICISTNHISALARLGLVD